MLNNNVSTKEHYEKMIDEGNDPFHDSIELQKYMERWTGPMFVDYLELDYDKVVLEIGVGTGRMARKVLNKGCRKLVGIDISPKTLNRAAANLITYENIELVEKDIIEFQCSEVFDVAYSVLTFMHIKDKRLAIENIVKALKGNGVIVLSLECNKRNCIDYGSRQIITYPSDAKKIMDYLVEMGCVIENSTIVEDKEERVATIIKAIKYDSKKA